MGGLGCPVAEFLTRAGVGSLGIVDYDNINYDKLLEVIYSKSELNIDKLETSSKYQT